MGHADDDQNTHTRESQRPMRRLCFEVEGIMLNSAEYLGALVVRSETCSGQYKVVLGRSGVGGRKDSNPKRPLWGSPESIDGVPRNTPLKSVVQLQLQ